MGLGIRGSGVQPTAWTIRWILKVLQDPKDLIPWEIWYHSIQRHPEILVSTGGAQAF